MVIQIYDFLNDVFIGIVKGGGTYIVPKKFQNRLISFFLFKL
jgi:hypothetical protein